MVCVWLTALDKGSKQSVKLHTMINMCVFHETGFSLYSCTPALKVLDALLVIKCRHLVVYKITKCK